MFVQEGDLSFGTRGMMGMSVVYISHGLKFTSSQRCFLSVFKQKDWISVLDYR